MKDTIIILGTGKIAHNIGIYLLKLNYVIHWYSENSEYLSILKKKVTKDIKRLHRHFPKDIDGSIQYYFHDKNSIVKLDKASIVIECIAESLVKKQRVILSVSPILKKFNPLILSTTSSILPHNIHQKCVGCHFFYPIELTEIVEIIKTNSSKNNKIDYLRSWIKKIGFSYIEQNEKKAFAINRLFLPIQAESFRLLINGYRPEEIDRATCSNFLSLGQFTLIDSIGIDVIYISVKNYIERMIDETQSDFSPLISGLKELIDMGKLGNKNKNGILCGDSLPWKLIDHKKNDKKDLNMNSLSDHFNYLFINTCRTFIQKGLLTTHQLELALSSVFHSNISFHEISKQISPNILKSYLDNLYNKTQLSYFKYNPKLID